MVLKAQKAVVTVLLSLFVITATGCEPLRKKFTRQKKKDTNQAEFIPVLDPIDYPAKVESPEESYRHYFSLWQVWDKELMMRLDEENASDKKINSTFGQLLIQLDEMVKLLAGDKRQKLTEYIAQLNRLQQDLKQPIEIRNQSTIEMKIERIGDDLREGFRFKDVETSLVK